MEKALSEPDSIRGIGFRWARTYFVSRANGFEDRGRGGRVCGVAVLTGSIYYRRRLFRGIWGHFGGQPGSGFQATIAVFYRVFGDRLQYVKFFRRPMLCPIELRALIVTK